MIVDKIWKMTTEVQTIGLAPRNVTSLFVCAITSHLLFLSHKTPHTHTHHHHHHHHTQRTPTAHFAHDALFRTSHAVATSIGLLFRSSHALCARPPGKKVLCKAPQARAHGSAERNLKRQVRCYCSKQYGNTHRGRGCCNGSEMGSHASVLHSS
jgi:hypothetical protein